MGKAINQEIYKQDGKLDNMVVEIKKADENITDAEKELIKAVEIQKKGCSKCWWYMIVLGLLLVIIVILVCVFTI